MATYIEINGNRYPATISGRLYDKDWNNRDSKSIKLELPYSEVVEMFVDDVEWSIVQEVEVQKEIINENEEIVIETVIELNSYDNTEYCVAGDVIDHRDGTVTVKMGKPTAEELLAILIGG
jgi:hypothetical protein